MSRLLRIRYDLQLLIKSCATYSAAKHFLTQDTHFTLVKELLAVTGGSQPDFAPELSWRAYQSKDLSPDTLCEALRLHNDAAEVVLLDSQGHKGERGTFSVLGLVHPQETLKVTYKVDDRRIRWGVGPVGKNLSELKLDSIDQVWPVLQRVLDAHNPRNHSISDQDLPTESPFWGGFAGYISYEAGLETIQVDSHRPSEIPDINFAFIQRSIIINHEQVSTSCLQSCLGGPLTKPTGSGLRSVSSS